jgi:UPF0042 nucleotide-binding protein
MRLIIVSGLSGSGKSIALQTLEDLDYYCVDNLPLDLLHAFMHSMRSGKRTHQEDTAVGIDARNAQSEPGLFGGVVERLKGEGCSVQILFLTASDEVLLKRFSETRRRHPLSGAEVSLADAIGLERRLMEPIAALADLLIDSSRTNVHELRQLVRDRVHETPDETISLQFTSFGFKHGVPIDADFVFDLRCLPNPYWEPGLRALTGLDQGVVDYLRSFPVVQQMQDQIHGFLEQWIPSFEDSGRSYLTVAVGCTGGRHRSVYMAEALSQRLRQSRRRVLTRHRELT